MLAALREKAARAAQTVLAKELQIKLKDKLAVFQSLKVSDVQDDSKYASFVIQPLWLYLKVQCGVAISGFQKFSDVDLEGRFRQGLFHVRNELIIVEGDSVKLVPDFNERLTPTVMQAIKGASEQ